MIEKSPDDICDEYFEKDVKISLKQVVGKRGVPILLIEGDHQSLEFLGKLIVAQAHFTKDCGFQIFPKGPGMSFFGPDSLGLYIHRLDLKGECGDEGG